MIFLAPPLEELHMSDSDCLPASLPKIFALALSVSLSLTLLPLADPR